MRYQTLRNRLASGVRSVSLVPAVLLWPCLVEIDGVLAQEEVGAPEDWPDPDAGGFVETDPLPQILAESYLLAEEDRYLEALQGLILAFETYPENEWNRDDYWRALVKGWAWFGCLGSSERQKLLTRCARPAAGESTTQVPFVDPLIQWMRDLLPGTCLQSPGGKLLLGVWNWQTGNYPIALGYAMGVLQRYPNSLAAEYGSMGLILARIHQRDFQAGSEDVRLITALMPDRPAAAWAVVQLNWWWCRVRQPDQASELNRQVLGRHPGTLAGHAAATMSALLDAAVARRYREALEEFERIRPYNHLAELPPMLDTLLIGIDWPKRHSDPQVRQQVKEMIRTLQELMEDTGRPFQAKMARMLLGYAYGWRLIDYRQGAATLAPLTAKDQDEPDLYTRAHALALTGLFLWRCDPKRSLEVLEVYADDYLDLPWSDDAIVMLAGLYLKTRQYALALEAFQWLKDRREFGLSLWPAPVDQVTGGIAGALLGLGRIGEAWQTIQPVIQGMSREELGRKLRLLSKEGFTREATFAQKQLIQEGRLGDEDR